MVECVERVSESDLALIKRFNRVLQDAMAQQRLVNEHLVERYALAPGEQVDDVTGVITRVGKQHTDTPGTEVE